MNCICFKKDIINSNYYLWEKILMKFNNMWK